MNKSLILFCIVLLQGCSSFYTEKYSKNNLFQFDDKIKGINQAKQKPFSQYDEPYLGEEVNYTPEQKRVLEQPVNIDSFSPVDISVVLNMLAEQTGLTYKLLTEINSDGNTEQNVSYNDDMYANNTQDTHRIKFDGKLSDFISYISNLYDINIELNNENILQASKYKNYAIKLDFYGQDSQYETSLNVSSNEGTSGSGFSGSSTTKFTSSFWSDIEKLASNNISSGIYTIFKDASILTFTGKNSEYRTLKSIVDEYQKSNAKQFVVSYKIYVLDKTKVDKIGSELGFQFSKSGTTIGLNNGMLDRLAGDINISSNFSGGENPKFKLGAQLDALYSLTGKEILQSGTFITKNNIPIPLNMTTSRHYVSGRSKAISTNSDLLETQITTDKVTVGTSFIITPRIMSDGNIEVVSGFTKSTLDSMSTFDEGGDEVMLPSVSSVEMFNTSLMRPGSIGIVSEFDVNEMGDDSKFGVFSFLVNSNNKNNTTVMVIGIDYYNSKPGYYE
ncbi:hypothetical protein AHYW_000577 [Providencia manganoxydans]|uniref:type II and III secretion system protein n=1 Tax=Providencia TaxID=586 RepID=UPI00111FFF8E|nr:type II and III secretion system protein [Providencia stuartii]